MHTIAIHTSCINIDSFYKPDLRLPSNQLLETSIFWKFKDFPVHQDLFGF